MKKTSKNPILKLKGPAAVYIDWANVYGWRKKMKWQIDYHKLFKYLKSYPEIKRVRFYFGTDTHPASAEMLKQIKQIGYTVITKAVKYLPVTTDQGKIWKRKCDFDLEIGLDAIESVKNVQTYIFFSGDGDFATLYKRLAKYQKQVIVISSSGSLGKEVAKLTNIYILKINRLKKSLKNTPPSKTRGVISRNLPKNPKKVKLL